MDDNKTNEKKDNGLEFPIKYINTYKPTDPPGTPVGYEIIDNGNGFIKVVPKY